MPLGRLPPSTAHRVFLVFCALALVWAVGPLTGHAAPRPPADTKPEAVCSLDVRSVPLGNALEKLAEQAGTEILLEDRWAGEVVSAYIKDKPLEESLRMILRAFNHALTFDTDASRVHIHIYGYARTGKSVAETLDRSDPATTAGAHRKRGVTQAEIDAIRAATPEIDPWEMEVTPPDETGGRGMTQAEIELAMAELPEIDRGEMEVLPPDEPGGKGITQAEIDAIRAAMPKIDPAEMEVTPPDKPGGKGMTQAQINAIRAKQQKINPADMEVTPPDKPGGKGITQAEIDALRRDAPRMVPGEMEVFPPE